MLLALSLDGGAFGLVLGDLLLEKRVLNAKLLIFLLEALRDVLKSDIALDFSLFV